MLDNTLVAPTDYSQYCVTAPTDPRLGSVSGQQLCGLYDLNPNKFGQNRSIVTGVSNYGEQTEIYDGVESLGERAAPEADGDRRVEHRDRGADGHDGRRDGRVAAEQLLRRGLAAAAVQLRHQGARSRTA